MGGKVRAIEPSIDGALEEYAVEARAGAPEQERGTGSATEAVARRVPRAIPADELGPNGVRVRELLDRAAVLTAGEARRLDEEAGWRWWPLAPMPGMNVAAARSAALVQGRTHGRSEAIVALDSAVEDIVQANAGVIGKRSRVGTCIANAALAILVEDLIGRDAFEILHAPWGAVLHQ